MTRSEALDLIRRALVRSITFDPDRALFVDEEEVDYNSPGPIVVRGSALRSLATEEDWRPYLEGPHSWLHANVLGEVAGTHVVALKLGPPAPGPRHAVGGHTINVNASVERRPLRVSE